MKKSFKLISIILTVMILSVLLVACHIKCDEHTFGEWINISDEQTPCESRRYCRMCEACEHLEYKDGTQDDHDFEVETVEPTCSTGGYDLKTCKVCGKTETDNETPVKHELSQEYLFDSDNHWQECDNCDYETEHTNHALNEDGFCGDCNQQIESTAGLIFDVNLTYCEVVGYEGTEQDVVIASLYENKPVLSINDNAFEDCIILNSIVIPDSVISLGDSVFYDCESLTSIVIGNSVTSIGNYAFYGCESLTSIDIPDSVTSVGERAFMACYQLEIVNIGKGLETFAEECFENCRALTSIKVSSQNTAYKSLDGNLYTKDGKTFVQYAIGKTDSSYTLLDSVESIGDKAFSVANNLITVNFSDNVKIIGEDAFGFCTNLENITIPDSIVSIGAQAFRGCSRLRYNDYDNAYYLGNTDNPYVLLVQAKSDNIVSCEINPSTKLINSDAFDSCGITSIIIPDSVTEIGNDAFYNCSNLTSVVIGSGVTSISDSAFNRCNSLVDVFFKGDEGEWDNVTIGRNNTSLTSATRYYYSETISSENGNFWCYDQSGEIVIWEISDDVIELRRLVDALKDEIDWSDDSFEPTNANIQTALEALELYYGMTEFLRSSFEAQELEPFVTVVVYHLYNLWKDEIVEYDDAITFTYKQGAVIVNLQCETYAEAKDSLQILKSADFKELAKQNTILSDVLADVNLWDLEFSQGVTIVDYCELAVPQSNIDAAIIDIEHAIELYGALSGVTINDVVDFDRVTANVKEKIEECMDVIRAKNDVCAKNVFATIESWQSDFFDVLYQYYYDLSQDIYAKDNSKDNCNNNEGLERLYELGYYEYLPEPLAAFYTASQKMYEQLLIDDTYGFVVDASNFYYYYDALVKALEDINNLSNELYKNLFDVMEFSYEYYATPVFAEQVILDAEYTCMNYYKVSGYGLAHYEELLDDYLPLVKMYLSGEYIANGGNGAPSQYEFSQSFKEKFPAFFEKFLAFPSGVQAQFLIDLSGVDGVLDLNVENPHTVLSLFLKYYYSEALDEDTFNVFRDLMVSYESFLKRNYTKPYGDISGFANNFSLAKNGYDKLNNEQKSKINFLYDHVNAIRNLYDDALKLKDIDLSAYPTWNDRLQKLADYMGEYAFAITYAPNYGAAGTFFVAAAKAEVEYTKILREISEVQDAQLKVLLFNAVQFKQYDILSKYFVTTTTYSIEEIFLMFRSQYLAMLQDTLVIDRKVSFVKYWNYENMERFATTADFTILAFKLTIGVEYDSYKIVNADFDAAFKSFIATDGEWTLDQKVVLMDLHYYSAMLVGDIFVTAFDLFYHYKLGFTSADAQAIDSFINMIYYHVYTQYYYSIGNTSTANRYSSQYLQKLNEFNQSFESLSQENKAKFESEFGADLINYYKQSPQQA